MSDERETPASRAKETPENAGNPGAPVEEAEASRTEVLEAVKRSRVSGTESGSGDGATTSSDEVLAEIAESKRAEEPKDADGAKDPDGPEAPVLAAGTTSAAQSDAKQAEAELERRRAISEVDTQMDLEPTPSRLSTGELKTPPPTLDDLPSAAKSDTPAAARDGEIRISADHPMAALYMQSPMPPEIRGNRGAGVLIALVGTLAFGAVLAGVFALWLAPKFPPSTFLSEGLVPMLMNVGFATALASFFVALAIVVLVVGRAGWWAYVLSGFLVAIAVWGATTLGLAAHDQFVFGQRVSWDPLELLRSYGFNVVSVAAGVVAREASIWFGAWIGARGRKVKLRNAEALAEYEDALAEAQAKQS